MSLYCPGGKCPKKEECLRYEAYVDFFKSHPEEEAKGTENGLWLVIPQFCVRSNFNDGVFKDQNKRQ